MNDQHHPRPEDLIHQLVNAVERTNLWLAAITGILMGAIIAGAVLL